MDPEIKQKKVVTGGRIAAAAAIIAVICIIFYISRRHSHEGPPEISPPKVTVQNPQSEQIVDYITQTGTLVAYNSVDLVARVEGYLDSIEFTDGTFVKKGQELFVVQPDTYYQQLLAAQATVAAQKAANIYAKSEYERQKKMYSQDATSLNNVEKWLAKTQESDAEIAKAVADEKIAEINYSYTHVSAPFDGRIGRHLVDPGNLVGHGAATTIATIEQIDPIYAYFNLNELDLIKLREAARAAGFKPEDINQISADIKLQNETVFKHRGKLDFVNTGLDSSTGTLQFRALLENKDYALLPGLFVQVRIPVSKPEKQMTIPDAAVLYDQIGSYVLIADENSVVQLKRIKIGAMEQEMRAVTQGLTASDRVIVGGLQFATPGNKVNILEQGSTN
ncbi:MAG: efflux RND transporter periplasmic adaptor subunit [Chlamydiales bacterium]|nr:efflux RND transporter periplasmic adaptor subunit [Chlamydiales bacterium]